MKRDNNTPSTIYFSPPSPNINFNALHNRPPHRESLPIDQFLPNPRAPESQHRYSNNLDPSTSNNAFAHLRNEISNLRSQFTKLIQKDTTSNNEKGKQDKFQLGSSKKDERVTAHSTIGFYNQTDNKSEGKLENKAEFSYFKSKLALTDHRNSIQNTEIQKKNKEENATSNKYQKKYSFQVQEKSAENALMQIDSKKIQELEVEIRKLGEIKHKIEEENQYLKKDTNRVEKELQSKINSLQLENERLSNAVEQAQISISLKNSLVEKLQNQHENYRKSLEIYQSQNRKLENELQTCKKELQTITLTQKIEIEKNYSRYEQQIQSLENIHQKNIKEILEKLSKTQELERAAQLALMQKEDECSKLKKENSRYEEKYQAQISNIQAFQINIRDLQTQHEQISKQYMIIQSKYQETLGKNDASKIEAADASRLKTMEDESLDLKKRVDSYKKTVQQLNSSNNSSRQKLVVLKEQSKKSREEAKYLSEQLQVKEKLITSLYRDINILDSQIRHSTHLKSILTVNLKYIEQLNQTIMELECERLNQRYKHLSEQCIQFSS